MERANGLDGRGNRRSPLVGCIHRAWGRVAHAFAYALAPIAPPNPVAFVLLAHVTQTLIVRWGHSSTPASGRRGRGTGIRSNPQYLH